jgi:cobalt-zinc-cadmium efflux system outer membrane protein
MPLPPPLPRPPKSPTPARSFLPLSLSLSLPLTLSLPLPAHAQPHPHALSESDVIRLAHQHDPQARSARELAGASDAQAIEDSLYPNPELAWDREHLPGSGPLAEREDTFALTIPIEFSGERSARSALARSEAAEARALASRARSDAALSALQRFYAALAAQRRVQIAAAAAERLSQAARVLARRFEEGTASGYDRTRIELEAELGRSELREAEAQAAADEIELAAWLGLPEGPLALNGGLELQADRGAQPGSAGVPRSLALASKAVAEAQRAQDSAGSAWLPALSATGGLKMTHAQSETAYGYVAGVTLDLPLLAHGQDVRAHASARARIASSQQEVLARGTQIAARRAAVELAAARSELAAFTAATGERVQQLERAAESAYREGQRSVLELLDAQRASLAVELRKLALALAAKRAEAALRAARGEFE